MKSVLIIFLIILSITSIKAQKDDLSWATWKNDLRHRWINWHLRKEKSIKLKQKWTEISTDLEKSKNKFAGTYFQYGFMSGSFLRWSPEKGFIYVQYFDNEHPCSFSYGKVSVKNLEITFHPEYETNPACPLVFPKSTPLKWIPALGGKYLIPANQAERFGSFYGGFGEFNRFYWNWNDAHPFARKWKDSVENKEKFILPKPYEKLIKKPINAEITFVGKTKIKQRKEGENVLFPMTPFNKFYSETSVKINVGENAGVTKNLEFIIVAGENDSETLKVINVGNKTSMAIVLRTVDDKKKEGYWDYNNENESLTKDFLKLQIGQKITTSLFVAEIL